MADSNSSGDDFQEIPVPSNLRHKRLLAELKKKMSINKSKKMKKNDLSPENQHEQLLSRPHSRAYNAVKNSRKIHLGWIHDSKVMRKGSGGGTRSFMVSKEADRRELLEDATKLFFPEGRSQKGNLCDLDCDILDFQRNPVVNTVGHFYELTKMPTLHYYLSTTSESFSVSGSTQPASVASGSTKPASVASGSTKPASVASGSTKPASVASGSTKPVSVATGSTQSALVASGSTQPVSVASGSTQPALVASGSTKPAFVASGSTQPARVASGSTQPVSVASGSTQSVLVASGSTQPVSVASGSTQPVSVASGSTQPALVTSGSTEPVSVASGSTQPALVASGSTQPVSVASGYTQPASVASGSTQPASAATESTKQASAVDTPFAVLGSAQQNDMKMEVKYCWECESSYSEVISRACMYSMSECIETIQLMDESDQLCNPLKHGYAVEKITVNGIVYLDTVRTEDNTTVLFPAYNGPMDEIILYGPDIIFGLEGNRFLVGLICSLHGYDNVFYQWFKDGELLDEGKDLMLMEVKQPGDYYAAVGVNIDNNNNPVIFVSNCITVNMQIGQEGGSISVIKEHMAADQNVESPTECPVPVAGQQNASYSTSALIQESEAHITDTHKTLQCSELIPGDATVNADMIQMVNSMNTQALGSPTNVSFSPVVQKHATPEPGCLAASATPSVLTSEVLQLTKADLTFPINSEIGRGAFGVVHKGEMFGASVAVKKIKILRAARIKSMALKETQNHYRLRHPNIVTLMAVVIEPAEFWIVSELVQGINLEELIYEPTSHGFPKATNVQKHDISIKCLQGLSYLHGICPPVIHRDIKPQNILVTHDLQVKLCDFGLSQLHSKGAVTTLHAGQIAGSPSYMAPELLLHSSHGEPPVKANEPSDVWSVGATIVELYAEQDLWLCDEENDNTLDFDLVTFIRAQMLKGTAPPAITLLPQLCVTVHDVLKNCFFYDPSLRPSTSGLLNTLRRITVT